MRVTVPVPAATRGPGERIADRFVIERVLGRGGFATVYLCASATSGRQYAIKVLDRDITSDATARQRFRLEAALLKLVTAPRLVQVHDFGTTADGACYLAMDYIDAPDVALWMHRFGRMQLGDALRVAQHVLEALSALHARSVVHRDVKPSNVLLRWDGVHRSSLEAILTDLGIAKVLDGALNPASGSRLTAPNQVVCTPLYAAPEVFAGLPQLASDVFSLGLMVAELIDGSLPDASLPASELRRRRCLLDGPRLGPRAAASPAAAWLRRCTALLPWERFGDADEALAALRTLVARLPEEAPGDAPPHAYVTGALAPTTVVHPLPSGAWTQSQPASAAVTRHTLALVGGSIADTARLAALLEKGPG